MQSLIYSSIFIFVLDCIFIDLYVFFSRGNLYDSVFLNISIIIQNNPYPFYTIVTSHRCNFYI
nr:MAG TPA: hypothetical protein [Caudoviricetes sp.]